MQKMKVPPRKVPFKAPVANRKPSHSGGLGRAKILTPEQFDEALASTETLSLYPGRDQCFLLLSHRAGMRSQEIALLWVEDVTDVRGRLTDTISVSKRAGKYGRARDIPMHPSIKEALAAYLSATGITEGPIFWSAQGRPMTPNAVQKQIASIYARCGFRGARSHSGRRGFITTAARTANMHNSSIKDVQLLAGHSDLKTTAGYIEASPGAVNLVASL